MGDIETIDELPESAREVENEYDARSFIMFPVSDVLLYYTVYEDGTVQRERFIAEKPSDPVILEEYMTGKDE